MKEVSRTIPGIRTTPGKRRRRPLLELVSDLEKFSPPSSPVIETLDVIDSPSEPVSPWDDNTPLPSPISETSESADEIEDEDEIHYGTAPSSIFGCGDSAGVEDEVAPTRPSESHTSAQSTSTINPEAQQYRAAKFPSSALQIFEALPTSSGLGHFNSGNDLHGPTTLSIIPEAGLADLPLDGISPFLHAVPFNSAPAADHVSHASNNDVAPIMNDPPPPISGPSSSIPLLESRPPPYSRLTDTLDKEDTSFSLHHRTRPSDADTRHSNSSTDSDHESYPIAGGWPPGKSEVQGGGDTIARVRSVCAQTEQI